MIFVFKTSVETKEQMEMLKPHIDHMLPNAKWNFDLDDCDKILRVVSDENVVLKMEELLNSFQFYCKELD